MDSQSHQQFYEELKNYLNLKLQKPFTKSKIALLIANGINYANKATQLSEDQARELILTALRDIVSATEKIEEDDKSDILLLIDLIGEDVFDKLLELANDMKTFVKSSILKCRRKEKSHITSYQRSVQGKLGHTSDEFNALKEYLTLKVQLPFTAGKVVGLLAAGIKFIEHFENLSGAEKKNLVIHALREVISSTTRIPEEDKQELLKLVDLVANEFIDVAVTFGTNTVTLFKQKCSKSSCCKAD